MKKSLILLGLTIILLSSFLIQTGYAQQVEAFVGEIKMFAGNFAPKDWALCDGQMLSIQQYQMLFAILGTTYGGDGRTTFALPDLRGRFPVHQGRGYGLQTKIIGNPGGVETIMPDKVKVASGDQTEVAKAERQYNLPPYLPINFIICINGIFPQRN